jgi:hypothetical protein
MLPTSVTESAVRSLSERSAYLVYITPTRVMQTQFVKPFKIPTHSSMISRFSSGQQVQDNHTAKWFALLSDLSTTASKFRLPQFRRAAVDYVQTMESDASALRCSVTVWDVSLGVPCLKTFEKAHAGSCNAVSCAEGLLPTSLGLHAYGQAALLAFARWSRSLDVLLRSGSERCALHGAAEGIRGPRIRCLEWFEKPVVLNSSRNPFF